MKRNLPVSGHERLMDKDRCIISTTDKKGKITNYNEYFVEITGFKEDELLGAAHNIIRHPDMPPAAFQNLWDVIKQGKPWIGVVKNRAKNGDHYWVDAYVTPVFEKGEITGYQSVRHCPDRKVVGRAEALYQSINNGSYGSFLSRIKSLFAPSYVNQLRFTIWLSSLLMLLPFSFLIDSPNYYHYLAMIFGSGAVSFMASNWLIQPIRQLAKESERIFSNAVARHVFTGRDDELGQLELTQKFLSLTMKTVVNRLENASEHIHAHSRQVTDKARDACEKTLHQLEDIAHASETMRQMTIATEEVAQSCAEAASVARQTDETSRQGRMFVTRTEQSIGKMVSEIRASMEVISALEKSSQSIEAILDVINGIAEKTNLLALNAAIEAARAGEQGRGFAVVADEVRNLAQSSQSSTAEIQTLLRTFQQETEDVCRLMSACEEQASGTVNEIKQAEKILIELGETIAHLGGMNQKIAATTVEQSSAAGELNELLEQIHKTSDDITTSNESMVSDSVALKEEAKDLSGMIQRFGLRD